MPAEDGVVCVLLFTGECSPHFARRFEPFGDEWVHGSRMGADWQLRGGKLKAKLAQPRVKSGESEPFVRDPKRREVCTRCLKKSPPGGARGAQDAHSQSGRRLGAPVELELARLQAASKGFKRQFNDQTRASVAEE